MTLNNTGTSPFLYRIPAASRVATDMIGAESVTRGTILPVPPFTDVIQPGGYKQVQLATDLGTLPPGDATHVMRINTNAQNTATELASASYAASL